MKQSDSALSLSDVLKNVNKKYGAGTLSYAEDNEGLEVEVMPTGCFSLDDVLGIGGLPKGRVIDVYGAPSSGKTALCMHLMAQVQKNGGSAAFIDAEFSFSSDYARKLGVDTEKLVFMQPDTGEEAFEVIEKLVHTGEIDLIVVDSTAALVPSSELEGEITDHNVALQARLLSKGLRMITGAAAKTKTTIIFISQVRDKIGSFVGPATDSTGGKAIKFFSSVRLEVNRIKSIEGDNKSVIGNRLKIKAVKNKVAPPFKEAEIELYFESGIDLAVDALEFGEKLGVVGKSGNTYLFAGEKIAVGRDGAANALRANKTLYENLKKAISEAHESSKSVTRAAQGERKEPQEDEAGSSPEAAAAKAGANKPTKTV